MHAAVARQEPAHLRRVLLGICAMLQQSPCTFGQLPAAAVATGCQQHQAASSSNDILVPAIRRCGGKAAGGWLLVLKSNSAPAAELLLLLSPHVTFWPSCCHEEIRTLFGAAVTSVEVVVTPGAAISMQVNA